MLRSDDSRALDVQVLSALLLDLYRYARESPIGGFQQRALRRLQEVLPFDQAWWGMARRLPGHLPELHSSFPFNLPREYVDGWELMKQSDELAQALHRNPGITVHFDAQRMRDSSAGRLAAQFGFTQAMSTLEVNSRLNLFTFVSLYRAAPEPRFNEQERLLKQCAMPHLVATSNINWISQLEHIRAHSARTRAAMAITDRRGILHTAEPRFGELLHLDWPGWEGPQLPAPLAGILKTQLRHVGSATISCTYPVGDLFLIETRTRSPADRLSPREQTIASGFSQGQSYKEIAEVLGLSPATVRHHLRRVYEKLGVSDKAMLSRVLTDPTAAAMHPEDFALANAERVPSGGKNSSDHE
jgi:DNA-binding CsgD family transcriptional regulator